MAKHVAKTPCGREQCHVNEYTLGCLQEQSEVADQCANTAATRILYLREEAVLRKTHLLN